MQLLEDEQGDYAWVISDTEATQDVNNIAEMVKSGMTIAAIAEKTGLSKSQVETRRNKAKEKGLC